MDDAGMDDSVGLIKKGSVRADAPLFYARLGRYGLETIDSIFRDAVRGNAGGDEGISIGRSESTCGNGFWRSLFLEPFWGEGDNL